MIEATAITKATERRIQLDDFCGVERKKVELQFLPTPDFYHFTIPSTHVVLVCSDGGQLAQELTENLISNGLRVVSLLLKKGSSAKHTYDISLADDQDLGRTIEQIRKDIGQIGGCIYLHPHMTFSGAQYDQHFTKEREWIKKAFLLAKHTKNDLVELGKETRSFFVTVSQMDGKLGYGDQYNMSVLGGGLSGLTKSLGLEWPTVFCRSIDMEPQMTVDVSSKQILSELHDPSRLISEVALHSSGRRTIVGIPTPIKGQDTIQSNIQSDDVFLVSGGAKGVTALCVIEMAKAFQSTFILLGRSDHSFALPDFAIDCDDDATLMKHIGNAIKEKGQKPSLQEIRSTLKKIQAKKEIDQTIKAVENHGSICKYIQVDVTNATEVKQSIANITSQTGPITGIIHGAGRLADKYIQDKTEKDFDNVLSVKLDGLQSMLKSINSQQLKHLILFSSVAGFYGNVGQTDYAIANEILSKIALLFKKNHPEVRIKALNWGAWDSGMVSGALKKKFEEMGVTLVNSEGGPRTLVHEMSDALTGEAQVILGGTLPAGEAYSEGPNRTHLIDRHLTLNQNPFLNHHVIQQNAVLPVVNAVTWMTAGAEQVYHGYTIQKVIDAQLFKGIVFDGNQLDTYTLHLSEQSKTADTIILRAQISSQQASMKLPTFHYRAEIHLIKKSSKPQLLKTNRMAPSLDSGHSGQYLYEDGSLFHGPYFRGIEKIIHWDEKKMLLACNAPFVPHQDQGQFQLQGVNSFFADIQYQGMVIWVQKYMDQARSLPLSTKSCTIHRPIPFNQLLYVQIDIIECTEHKLVANCTTFDEEGTIYMQTQEAAVTISKELKW